MYNIFSLSSDFLKRAIYQNIKKRNWVGTNSETPKSVKFSTPRSLKQIADPV